MNRGHKPPKSVLNNSCDYLSTQYCINGFIWGYIKYTHTSIHVHPYSNKTAGKPTQQLSSSVLYTVLTTTVIVTELERITYFHKLVNMGCGSARIAGASFVMELRASPDTNLSQVPSKAGGKGKVLIKVCRGHPWLMKEGSIAVSDAANITDVCVLGTGLMGTVRLSKWVRGSENLYIAMKAIRKDYVLKHHDERHIDNEKKIMAMCTSAFIIRLFGTFQDEDCVYLNMEFAIGGELFSYLNSRRYFPPEMAKFYGAEIFLALDHVQKHGFVYRDLKPEVRAVRPM